MPQRTFTLSTVAAGTIGAASGRKSVVITNKDAAINVALVDHISDGFASGVTLAPAEKASYVREFDGAERLDKDFLMVAASGTPSVAIQENY